MEADHLIAEVEIAGIIRFSPCVYAAPRVQDARLVGNAQ